MAKLEERIRVHDKDIERMCNYHYQGFIESVNELLKVRGEARKLKVFYFTYEKGVVCLVYCDAIWLASYWIWFILSILVDC